MKRRGQLAGSFGRVFFALRQMRPLVDTGMWLRHADFTGTIFGNLANTNKQLFTALSIETDLAQLTISLNLEAPLVSHRCNLPAEAT